MDVRELRIGNLIVANGLYEGKQMTVGGISGQGTMSPDKRVIMFQDYAVGEFVKDCSGIPLTSELLERMGFKDKQVYENVDEWYRKPLCLQTDQDIFMAVRIGVDDLEIKYVHQLQNLYWCLCGEELVLKPK